MRSSLVVQWGVLTLFFVSGAPALLYQIIWQRHLGTIFGTHAESAAIIVGAFMFGLGLGSIVGGEVSLRWKRSPFTLFAVIECLIGLFGFYSLQLFDAVGRMTTDVGITGGGIASFLLVIIPTTAMGATLPILANALIARFRNVGVSVGSLYFVNTLGSACAALGSIFFFSAGFGQHDGVVFAVSLNLTVVVFALVLRFLSLRQEELEKAAVPVAPRNAVIDERGPLGGSLSQAHLFAMTLSFLSGFLALSVEILWFRVIFLYTNGRAVAFPLALAFFLFGIAFGSLQSSLFIRAQKGLDPKYIRERIAMVVLISGVAISLGFFLSGLLIVNGLGAALFLLTTLIAFPLGILFPLLMHTGVLPDMRAGRSVSHIYAANILGSTIGSVGTGFVLLNLLSLRAIVVMLSVLSLALALVLFRGAAKARVVFVAALALVLLGVTYVYNGTLYEKIQIGKEYKADDQFAHVVENRSGVIAVTQDATVYGSGAYDGRFSTDIVGDSNIIIRPYSLSAFHADPERILVIGLSSGSWAQVLANHPGVKHVDIVEINPGYLKLIPEYPVVASLLANPRVTITIEDGRRYLVRHPQQTYDAIVMNTTFHWRAGITNLLSREFLEVLRAHLRKGGIVIYNTTNSDIVNKTGMTVFPYAWRIANALVVSDSPLSIDRDRLLSVLKEYQIDGKPVLDLHTAMGTAALAYIESEFDPTQHFSASTLLEPRDSFMARLSGVPLLTDDNMLVEWRKDQE